MLYQYAVDFGKDFAPYALQVATIMIPLVNFGYQENVRIAATAALPVLLESMVKGSMEAGIDLSPCQKIFFDMLNALLSVFEALGSVEEVDIESLCLVCEVIGGILEVVDDSNDNGASGVVLPIDMVPSIVNIILEVLYLVLPIIATIK